MVTDADLTLLIDRARFETPDILVLDLVAPDHGVLPSWKPGAHVDLLLKSGKVRQYSLCGDPADPMRYRIAVLREATGRGGSLELHASAATGVTLGARGPRNHFELIEAPQYLFLAGGIRRHTLSAHDPGRGTCGPAVAIDIWRAVASHDGLCD